MNLVELRDRIKVIEEEILRKHNELAELNEELGNKRALLVAHCPHPREFTKREEMQGVEDRCLETCTICGGVDIKAC